MTEKNKENNLEKQSKGYTWKNALIPFIFLFKKYRSPSTNKEVNYMLANIIGSILIFTGPLLYAGVLDMIKGSEAQKNFRFEDTSNQTFNKYDINQDGVLDSKEFRNYYLMETK